MNALMLGLKSRMQLWQRHKLLLVERHFQRLDELEPDPQRPPLDLTRVRGGCG